MPNVILSAIIALTLSVGGWFGLQQVQQNNPTVFGDVRVFTVSQGGTGASTLTGCLEGNGTGAITGTGSNCGTGGGGGGLASSTPWTFGSLVVAKSNSAVTTIATSTIKTSELTNDAGFLSSYTSPFEIATTSGLTTGFTYFTKTSGMTTLGSIASSSIQLSWFNNDSAFITGAQVPANETDAAHDTCAEITGCVTGALTTVDISANTNLTAGDALTLTGDDIDFDGGTSPGGSLGGTWASPTIDDLFILNTGDVGTGSYTFPYASSTGFSSSYASSTFGNFGTFTFGGVTSSTWPDFCVTITGSADLCDGSDASGAGGSSAFEIATGTPALSNLAYFSKVSGRTTLEGVATTTVTATSPLSLSNTVWKVGGSNSVLTISTTTNSLFSGIGGQILVYNDGIGYVPFATTSMPLGGDVTGTLGTTVVGDNSHAHDSTTISGLGTADISGLDVSDDLNLTGGLGLTLTGDDMACDTASASVFGCLSASDFSKFNSATTTFTYPLVYTLGTNAVTYIGFSTTTDTGIGNNLILYTSNTGIVKGVASSSLSLPNTALQNSTISGIALGSNLANLTATDGTLTFSGTYTGATARTIGLNLANANTWSVLQTFNYSSSTAYSSFLNSSSTFSNIGTLTFGGVTGSAWSTFCTSITGSAGLCDGDDASGAGGSSAYEIATTSDIAVPQVAYFTQTGGRTTIGSVATGTISVPTGLTVTANRSTLGGATAIGLDTGYVIPLQTTLDGKEDDLTFNYPFSRSVNTISWSGLGTTSAWTTGQLAYVSNNNTLTSVATTTVTATSPLSLSNPVVKVGGSNSVLSIDTSGSWTGSAGSVANALTNDATLNGSSFNGSAAVSDWGLNLANLNTWTGLQTFAHSSTTGQASFIHASTTLFTFGGVTGDQWTDFCTSITGSAGLCDGDDATGGAGFTGAANSIIVSNATGDGLVATSSQLYTGTLFATSTYGVATSTFIGAVGVGTTTPSFDNLFTVGTSTWTGISVNGRNQKIGFGCDNVSPSRYAFGCGTNTNVNTNINLLVQDASDARMGVSTSDDFVGFKSSSGNLGLFAFDYAAGLGKNINVQEFGGNLGIATATPWGLLSVNANALGAGVPQFVVGSSTGTNLIVANNGNVGVGTTTPGSIFSIQGVANFVSSAVSTIYNGLRVLVALVIPNGTAPTVNEVGRIAFDITDNQFIIGTSTAEATIALPLKQKLWSGTIASTSVDFVSGGRIPLNSWSDGVIITEIRCAVDAGTSKAINLDTLASGANTDSVTCGTSETSDTAMSANYNISAGTMMAIELGATSGSVDYVSFSVWGYVLRE